MNTDEHVANITDRYPEEKGCDSTSYRCDNPQHQGAVDWSKDPHCTLPEDDGTMVENIQELRDAVVGRKIIKAEKRELTDAEIAAVKRTEKYFRPYREEYLILELDNGRQVILGDTSDCCACTTLDKFLYNPAGVDHMILGVGTEGGFDTWHIYADFGDVLKLDVEWSPGNPFYYGYGFDIRVIPITLEGEVIEDVPELPGARLAIES